MSYRYLLLDSTTRTVVAELPLLAGRFGEVINDRGSFSVTMPLDMPEVPITLADVDPPKALFAVERDGALLYVGWVWTWEADIEADTFTINGEGYLSYFGRVLWETSLSYNNDQVDIMAAFLAYGQYKTPESYVGVDVSRAVSQGIIRERTYPAYGGKTVEDLLRSLSGSNILNGADFTFLPRWDGSPPTLMVDFYVHQEPRYGRDSGLVLSLGANADLLGLTGDASAKRFHTLAIGAGDEVLAITGSATASDLAASSRMLESADVFPTVSEQATLDGHATRLTDLYSKTIVVPRVRVDDTLFGQFIVGDRVTVEGSYGLVDLNAVYRVTAWEATLSDAQTFVDLTLSPLSLFL